ncbi:MAG: sulfatase [Bacteroidetes bacterium]|nr:sulfatase [Bacteroidota bacterium]
MKKNISILIVLCSMLALPGRANEKSQLTPKQKPPNILFAIADDQSFPYASIYGENGVSTPAFDKVAEKGVLFTNAFVAAPQCSPSRAAILTGKNIWQLEEAGTHGSYFPKKFQVFTDLLESAGYAIGFTGKPWGPGNWKDAGWLRNPVGPEFNDKVFSSVPAKGISRTDYFENFKEFYSQKTGDSPFFFWYGGHEPHRVYEDGSGIKAGKNLSDAMVPSFLPETDLVKSDVLDFTFEVEWFDTQLGKMLKFLDEKGELENTLIVITADNGMPFPSAKANLQEYGTHVPLAICWPKKIAGNRVVTDLVGMIDLAPTFMEIAAIQNAPGMTGKSLSKILFSEKQGVVDSDRKYVFTGRERHTHARPDNLGYPARAVRTADYLYVWNIKSDRWPAGNPVPKGAKNTPAKNGTKNLLPGYHDVDGSPSKQFLLDEKDVWPKYFDLAYGKRPAEQLYDIKNDPGCVNNLADNPELLRVKEDLNKVLMDELKKQGDPRVLGNGDIFESYPRFGSMRNFPGFKERGKYNPAFINGNEMINQN